MNAADTARLTAEWELGQDLRRHAAAIVARAASRLAWGAITEAQGRDDDDALDNRATLED